MKLKPCPLCQNETFGVEHKKVFMELTLEMGDLVAIHCYNCLASITRPTKEKAVEAWNHRPLEDALKTHAVEVLAGQLDILSLYKKFYVYVKDLSLLDEKDLKSYGIDTTSFVVRLNFGSDVLPVAEARTLLGWEG